ncbi:MAG: hypothetical protein ACKVTZ_14730 [Bacteroidia bacterium]
MAARTFISFDWAIKKVLKLFLKNSDIKEDFTAKGLSEAKLILRYENMTAADRAAYDRHRENRRIEKSVIAFATKLTLEEIMQLENGEDIDKEED